MPGRQQNCGQLCKGRQVGSCGLQQKYQGQRSPLEAPKKKRAAGLLSRSDGSPVIARCVPWSEGRYEVKPTSVKISNMHSQAKTYWHCSSDKDWGLNVDTQKDFLQHFFHVVFCYVLFCFPQTSDQRVCSSTSQSWPWRQVATSREKAL